MSTPRPRYTPDLTNDEPLPVREALARVWPHIDHLTVAGWGCTRATRGYSSTELSDLSCLVSNRARDTGRQWARWHSPLAECAVSA